MRSSIFVLLVLLFLFVLVLFLLLVLILFFVLVLVLLLVLVLILVLAVLVIHTILQTAVPHYIFARAGARFGYGDSMERFVRLYAERDTKMRSF